jgi:F-box protein, helicase, 18
MNLTQEQYDIINSTGNIKINAVAGSGKTTTIIEYAKARPKNARILYLAFNKSMKSEAIKRFTSKGLQNVTVETAHSLAYRHICRQNNYKIRPQGLKPTEVSLPGYRKQPKFRAFTRIAVPAQLNIGSSPDLSMI